MQSVQQARRGILVFIVALTGTTIGSIWLRERVTSPALASVAFPMLMTTLLSYSPAIASLIARMSLGESLKDVSFRLRGDWTAKAMLIAWLWPAFCGLGTFGVAWAAGLTRFAWTSVGLGYGTWGPENLLGLSVAGVPVLQGFAIRLVASVFFAIPACLQSLGEELGWRGYLLTRLFDAKIPTPVLWSGLIWGLWHIPFFLAWEPSRNLGERRSVSLFFFVASTVALAYLLGYLRLRSGSIWPAVLGHASGNTILSWAFDGFTVANQFWKGELYLLSTGFPVLIILLARPPWIIRYWPSRSDDRGSLASSTKLTCLD
jgi:CAAX protease family protein